MDQPGWLSLSNERVDESDADDRRYTMIEGAPGHRAILLSRARQGPQGPQTLSLL